MRYVCECHEKPAHKMALEANPDWRLVPQFGQKQGLGKWHCKVTGDSQTTVKVRAKR